MAACSSCAVFVHILENCGGETEENVRRKGNEVERCDEGFDWIWRELPIGVTQKGANSCFEFGLANMEIENPRGDFC